MSNCPWDSGLLARGIIGMLGTIVGNRRRPVDGMSLFPEELWKDASCGGREVLLVLLLFPGQTRIV